MAVMHQVSTTAGTHLMHESFNVDDPAIFTREWFGWANSLFSKLMLAQLGALPRSSAESSAGPAIDQGAVQRAVKADGRTFPPKESVGHGVFEYPTREAQLASGGVVAEGELGAAQIDVEEGF
ncbi:metal-independent alpha-mannosidase (plasmid) [Deinococcus psychrotolerans]|uniref:Metal-independent alpha-mannosidase n=1 Tax=Deinococcus psychrotolerans TaxID=2489213 RepID=A0A3G8YIM3_9DEIO|nr:metal-independent alpha-mannosidase [Deinococcus psychrotolerans]